MVMVMVIVVSVSTVSVHPLRHAHHLAEHGAVHGLTVDQLVRTHRHATLRWKRLRHDAQSCVP